MHLVGWYPEVMAKSIFTSSSSVGDDRRTAIMKISNAIGELKVSYKTYARPMGKIVSSRDSYEFLKAVWDEDLIEYQEQFCLLFLSRSNHIIAYNFVSTGGTASTIVDAKMVFQAALLCNAVSIILAHNHPSGNLSPSEGDKRMTQRVFRIGKDLDMPVLDHIIISKDGYYSFADEAMLY